jgi:predicted RNA-binding protein YlxR (DUF448 family)
MSKKGHVPIRMCIGCRKKREKGEMIRLTQYSEGMVRVDERKHIQGRGFYLCPDLGCLSIAKKKNKGIGFLETMDFQSLLVRRSSRKKGWDIGIEEEGNDKE